MEIVVLYDSARPYTTKITQEKILELGLSPSRVFPRLRIYKLIFISLSSREIEQNPNNEQYEEASKTFLD